MKNKALYLFFTAAILLLTLGFVHVQELRRDLDQRMLEHVEEMMKLLEESETENRELREENRELERLRYIRAEQRTLLASRGGRPSIPVQSASGMTAEHFEAAFAALGKPGMSGLGEALVLAEQETGANALVVAAIASLESGWGTSLLARTKCNLGGLGALDDDPGLAMTFGGRAECVMFLAALICDGGTVEEVGRWYASDPAWAAKVTGCMKLIGGAL